MRDAGRRALQHCAAPEVQVDARRSASRGSQLGIGVDRGDAEANAQEGPEEELVEEVVLERRLADLAERGVFAREPEAHAAAVTAELERQLSLRLRLIEGGVLGIRGHARHEDH